MNPFDGYRITSPFGWRTSPISGKREFHTGIDLVKSHKAPIHALADGEVIHAREGISGSGFGGYGITVAIRCRETGHLHCYAHLHSVNVRVGQIVSKGDAIGLQGNTGQSTGSHLHYEIRKKSSPQYGWIADRANNCFEPTQYLIEKYKKSEVKPRMNPEDANKIISIIQAHYGVVSTLEGAKVANTLKEFGRLADEVRVASGQRARNAINE